MWALGAKARRAPLAYRLKRLWRRRRVRRLSLVHGPILVASIAIGLIATDPRVQDSVMSRVEAARAAVTARPEFAINRVIVEGASPAVEAEIRAALFDVTGASSLALDAAALLRRIKQLGWVSRAAVTLEAPNLLRVAIEERAAAAVWRVDGDLWLIGSDGARITALFGRDDYPTLPLIVGEGADRAVPEALSLVAQAGALKPRLRGLARVGERRWDMVLDRGQRISLPMATPGEPSTGPVAALRAALALHRRTGVLDRDVAALDMRLQERPTIRLNRRAAESRAVALADGGQG
jgi:cell division protein FtsQ